MPAPFGCNRKDRSALRVAGRLDASGCAGRRAETCSVVGAPPAPARGRIRASRETFRPWFPAVRAAGPLRLAWPAGDRLALRPMRTGPRGAAGPLRPQRRGSLIASRRGARCPRVMPGGARRWPCRGHGALASPTGVPGACPAAAARDSAREIGSRPVCRGYAPVFRPWPRPRPRAPHTSPGHSAGGAPPRAAHLALPAARPPGSLFRTLRSPPSPRVGVRRGRAPPGAVWEE